MALVLTTDGGPHTAETWALASAEYLFRSMTPFGKVRPIELQKAEISTASNLLNVYKTIQDHERNRLASAAEIWVEHNIEIYLNDIVKAVQDAVADTSHAAHFAKDDVVAWIKQICGQHAIDMQHIERLWHRDRGAN